MKKAVAHRGGTAGQPLPHGPLEGCQTKEIGTSLEALSVFSMQMAVMQVWVMWVLVHHRLMLMPVRMRLA